MEFMKLGEKERKLLLTALDFDIDKLNCQYCKEKVTYQKCSIMPPIKTDKQATITCDSPLCTVEYLEDIEKDEEENSIPVKDVEEIIDKLDYPDYKCDKCGWVGKSADMVYDSDAFESYCPKCNNEIEVSNPPERVRAFQDIRKELQSLIQNKDKKEG